MSTVINYLTTIHFGAGSRQLLSAILSQVGVSRPLLVTDRGIVDAGLADDLPMSTNARFSEVRTNPDEQSALAGAQTYRDHDCDGIVALGGGSPIDCAKAIGLLVTHPRPLSQYALINDGLPRITADKPPLIAIPTTAGTGSEVGRAALITMSNGNKLGVISPHMIPTVAVCDPELTLGLPPRLTAATGMDAISHCVETFCSRTENPVADAIAIDGLARAVGSIRNAVEHGHELQHRSEMLMASLQGGLTFQKGLGMIHSLSHPLGGLRSKRLHHGMLNAIFLPHVLRYNAGECPEKIQRMAAAIGCQDPTTLPDFFAQLIADIGLPTKLSDLNVDATDLRGIAEAAMRDHSTPCNPREMTLVECERMLRAAL